jgi:hypothetical protein
MIKYKTDFEKMLQPNGYACETLINGNIKESINYLNKLIDLGFFIIAHDELVMIKENLPNRYDYIKSKLTFQNKPTQ